MNDNPGNRHRNDIYGDLNDSIGNDNVIPAATVVLVRDGRADTEVLMLHRTSKVHFGGMWAFPGGRIDDGDFPSDGDIEKAARNAAARETMEEAGISVLPNEFVCFAHWTPPPSTPRRYATWFFATAVEAGQTIRVDGEEIQDYRWIHPDAMLANHAAGEVALAPPTWITLYHLSLYRPVSHLLDNLGSGPRRIYQTRIGQRRDGARVAMWTGDAGYQSGDADAEGDRHRLVMSDGGFIFENTVEEY